MLSRIHQWKPLHWIFASSVILARPSVSVSAARLEPATVTTSFFPDQNDSVREILTGLNSLGFRAYVGGCNFRTVVSTLSETVVDGVLDSLRTLKPDVAVAFFYLLINEYGFRHSRFSQFVVSHILAGEGRFKELHSVIKHLIEEQGIVLGLSFVMIDWLMLRGAAGKSRLVWEFF